MAHALSFAFGAAALTIGAMQPAMAQSNTTGNIVGRVEAPAGASVVLRNVDTGLKRTVTPEADGRYLVTALPVGRYKVELMRGNSVVDSTEVEVIIARASTRPS
ncbi:carboxypeptidase regulatory-like domain-containing protein, partial [Massilia cavernae]